ncbi:class C sortase [Enterococcus florum]|uniref:Class C sortase n=1 Tax=Enterococcus florum TaxID=2480627 RepID=A0A4P5PE52_9ENTE|nr:class C sortase [Enterococcus florum]GCF93882.1 class C sortase [Enterococcus florum]
MKKKAPKKFKDIVAIIIFLLGLGLFLYPTISNYLMVRSQTMVVEHYETKVKEIPKKKKEDLKEKIAAYNDQQNGVVEKAQDTKGNAKDEDGQEVFDVMQALLGEEVGTLNIPEIHVTLPIYQGTSEDVLQKGTGLLEGSAIPIGGKGTHAVITGHSGLPNAKIFTDLPKMKVGDIFYIQSFDEKLAYKVDKLATVEPEETDALRAEADKDYATLITCVPISVNSHRLFVRGHRIPYKEKEKKTVDKKAQRSFKWARVKEYLVFAGAILLLLLLIAYLRYRRKRKKSGGEMGGRKNEKG